jgi:hypothetical protein
MSLRISGKRKKKKPKKKEKKKRISGKPGAGGSRL